MADTEIKTKLPAATVERWRSIVEKASRSGTDISQLVQHFAETSFQNKVALLANQGVHRRALTDMRQVVHREVQKAERAAAGPLQPRTTQLMRPYQASRFDFRPPRPGAVHSTQQTQGPRKVSIKEVPTSFTGEEHGCTIVPLKPPLTTPDQLRTYVATLTQQLEQIDKDIVEIDSVLNQGVRNHQAVVDDLAATSRELYRLAMEFLGPQATAPQPMGDEATATYAGEPTEKPER